MLKMLKTAVICMLIALPAAASAQIVVDDLETSPVGRFPPKWRTWPFQRGKATEVYKVGEDNGKRVLQASDDKDISTAIMRYFNWDIAKYPYLSWRWKAKTLPAGAHEDDDNTNDSACGVYVIVGGYTGNAVKYVWSTALPAGKVVTRRDGKLKIKVADTGAAGLGKWRSHSVNAAEDYKALFGEALKKNPNGIGVLTDGNATHTPAACDYSDFTISKEPLK